MNEFLHLVSISLPNELKISESCLNTYLASKYSFNKSA